MNEFNKTLLKIKREISHFSKRSVISEQKNYLFDLLNESVFPRIWRLFDFIKNELKNFEEKKLIFSKNDLLSLTDNNWKYYNELKNSPEDFSLTIIYSSINSRLLNLDFGFQLQGEMCEFANPKNWKEEYIWINSKFKDFNDESFDDLLIHEFGHVWTFLFGNDDENFQIGQSEFQNRFSYSYEDMTKFQKDVLIYFYNRKIELLEKDFNYVLSKSELDGSNYELTSNIDEMIELLVSDYLEILNKKQIKTFDYLWDFNEKMKSENSLEYSKLNIVKHYQFSKQYENLKNVQHIRNIIRRIFLIYSFGTNSQKEYFYKECEKEFGKL